MRFSGHLLPQPIWLRRNPRVNKFINASIAGFILAVTGYSEVAFQDMESLTTGDKRWLMHVPQEPGHTIINASMSDQASESIDPLTTGATTSNHRVPDKRYLAKRMGARITTTHKPEYIIRSTKGDRLISNAFTRPPVKFSAGSVVERHSWLSPLDSGKKTDSAFVQPKSSDEIFQIAAAFHLKDAEQQKKLHGLPVMVANLVVESQSSVLAYSDEPEVNYSPFAAVLKGDQSETNIPKLNRGDHLWADDPLPRNSFSAKQQECLANGVYFEARGEPVRGQAAVAQVILNRVRNPTYPNTICGVVYQNKNWRNRCQFSFACDRVRDRINNRKLWQMAEHVARETTAGRIWLSQVGSSTHYHATYVSPKWARSMKKVGKIGLHIFYRTFGGGWS